jgi:hypothetical protein
MKGTSMGIQVIVQQKGPLPITVNFTPPGDSPMYLEVSGSVWTTTANNAIGIQVQVDGQTLGVCQLFSNGPNTHRAVVPGYFPLKLTYAQHSLVLSAAPGTTTTSDYNDFFTAVIHY